MATAVQQIGSGTKPSKVDRAYGELLALIEAGAEYPDACDKVSAQLGLSDSQRVALEKKYDSEPSGRACTAFDKAQQLAISAKYESHLVACEQFDTEKVQQEAEVQS